MRSTLFVTENGSTPRGSPPAGPANSGSMYICFSALPRSVRLSNAFGPPKPNTVRQIPSRPSQRRNASKSSAKVGTSRALSSREPAAQAGSGGTSPAASGESNTERRRTPV